ncbi:redoxin domain-containing protein [Candidatus Desantisbacteria bacterium]|nr:redoxin domain-containing protein [Candidatus Desantisbacteria bacterium]
MLSRKKDILLIFLLLLFMQENLLAFKRIKENNNIPEISAEDIDGKKIQTSAYKGQKTLAIVFWKYPSLRGEKALVLFQKFYDSYHGNFPFEIISIYVPQEDDKLTEEEMTEVRKIISSNKITFPVIIDKGMEIFNKFGIISFPSFGLVDKEGVLIYELPGLPEFFGEKDLTKNVKKALGIKEEEKVIAKAAYIAKNNSSFYLNLAKQVYKKGNTDQAIEHTQTAVLRDPDYAEGYSYLGFLYNQKKEYNKSKDAYIKSLSLDPARSDTLLTYGFFCLEAGFNEDAYLQFKNIIQITPEKAAEGHFGLGTIYMKDGVFDSARQHQEKAIELYKTWKEFSQEEEIHFAMSYYNLGETELKLGLKKDAIENFKQAFIIYKGIATTMLKGKESMLDYSVK